MKSILDKLINSRRNFSTINNHINKQWRLIECRRVKKTPDYKLGDTLPVYISNKKPIKVPEYKYGESKIFKQSNKGLYGGQFLQYGNSISESKHAIRRRWMPNIIRKSLWSEVLNKDIKIKLTTKVLKTISKEGGIDRYLTKEKSARIKELGPMGWKLRYELLKKLQDPPHNDKEIKINEKIGIMNKIYYKEKIDNIEYDIKVGRRKIMKTLFALEKLENRIDGKTLKYKEFVEFTREKNTNDLLVRLKELGYDLKEMSC